MTITISSKPLRHPKVLQPLKNLCAAALACLGAVLAPHAAASYQVLHQVDIDGNGRSALVVRSATTTPEIKVGRFANNAFTFTNTPDPGINFRLLGAGRLNAGTKSDLLFQNIVQGEFGEAFSWLDFDSTQNRLLRNVKRVWNVQAVGDLDGDGFGDLVWRYVVSDSPDTGVSYIWFTNGAPFTDATIADPKNVVQVRKRGGAPLGWNLLGAADINGDAAADMVYISPTGDIRILMATAARTCANIGGGAIPGGFTALRFSRFSAAGRADILLRNANSGAVQLATLNATGLTLPPYTGLPDNQNASCTSSTLTAATSVITLPSTDPTWAFYAVGDYDGNGIFDISWVRPNGQLTVWLMQPNGVAPTIIDNAGTAPFYPAATQEGTLTDAPVAGVRYVTTSGVNGVTDVGGRYRFNQGDSITFSLGTLSIGTLLAQSVLTPLELAAGNANRLSNLLVLFQSLDADGVPANGINITAPAAAAITTAINLDQPAVTFASSANIALQSAMTTAGIMRPISAIADANAHFASQGLQILSSNIWFITNGTNDSAMVRFGANGEYLVGQAAFDSHLGYGTVRVTGFDTGGFILVGTPVISLPAGAWGGFSAQSRYRSNGESFINAMGETMNKAENIPGSLVGVWAFLPTAIKTQTILFTSAGKFLLSDPIGDDSCAIPGVEYGNYSYNTTSKAFTVSNVIFDTNRCAGLRDSTNGSLFSGTVNLSADGMTASVTPPGEPSFTIYRVSK